MSVQKRGSRYIVRWREGGTQRSRTFLLKGDANAFDLDLKRRQQLGPIASGVIQSRMTLAQFVLEDWWPRYAIPNLKASTRKRYLETWGAHLLDRLGGYELRAITPMLVEDFRDQLQNSGVSSSEQRRALMLLQGILRRAVVRGLLPMNAAQLAEKPRQTAVRRPEPLSPATVERIRGFMPRHRDRTLVSVLAYAGLRPGEATGLRWKDLHGQTIYVHASKTERPRSVRLLAPLSQDLAEWRMASGRPPDLALIFPTLDGDAWKLHDWNNWRRRIYQPAAESAGVTGDMRPYRCRGSFVSLLLAEGRTLIYVSQQAGHSVATLARHYAAVIEELAEQPQASAEDAIREARANLECGESGIRVGTKKLEHLGSTGRERRDSNPRPPA